VIPTVLTAFSGAASAVVDTSKPVPPHWSDTPSDPMVCNDAQKDST
jgi:hypothetical protein